MKPYKEAEVYTANMTPKGVWNVHFSYRHPETGKFKRFQLYNGHNRIECLKQRLAKFRELKDEINFKLKKGWNPFVESYTPHETVNFEAGTILAALQDVLVNKKAFHKKTSYKSFKTHIDVFSNFLSKSKLHLLKPYQVEKRHINMFLNSLLHSRACTRTRNNYLVDLHAAFNYLLKVEETISKNPCTGIEYLPSRSETHIAYSEEEFAEIKKWLDKNDPLLSFFIKFIFYCFLRVGETRDIKIGYFDLTNYEIRMPARDIKTGRPQIKPILDIFREEIKALNLQQYPKDYYLFGSNGKPGKKPMDEKFFRRRFKKLKLDLGFTAKHTIYGFRHTSVCHLIRMGVDKYTVMKYTGHTTLDAFEKYLRDLMAERPEDISKYYAMKL